MANPTDQVMTGTQSVTTGRPPQQQVATASQSVTTGRPPQQQVATASQSVTTGKPPVQQTTQRPPATPQQGMTEQLQSAAGARAAQLDNSWDPTTLPQEGGGYGGGFGNWNPGKPGGGLGVGPGGSSTGGGSTGGGGTGGGSNGGGSNGGGGNGGGTTSITEPVTPGSSSPGDSSSGSYDAYNSSAQAATQGLVSSVDMTDQINQANEAWGQAVQNYGDQAQQILGDYGAGTTQNIGDYQGNAQGIIDQLSSLTGQQLADYAAQSGQTIDQAVTQINDIIAGLQQNLRPVGAGRVGNVDTVEQENLLSQITGAAQQQAENRINYGVNQGVNELQRAEEDAAAQFQTQRDQIAAQERTNKDNQALYSEMRGDRGGIGRAQYDAIANTAATNQLTVNNAQTKLATDTSRQIADLRAQGEFQKADELLQITQSYLSQLMQLKQWADATNVSIDEFNIGVEQWEQEYNAKIQQVLGQMGIDAAQYGAAQNLAQQQYLTEAGINAAQTTAQQQLGLASDINQQKQNLQNILAQYGLSINENQTNALISQLQGILSAQQNNASTMANTEINAANLFGVGSNGAQTLDSYKWQQNQLASVAEQMIANGLTPTPEQLAALGWTQDQYDAYKDAQAAAAAAAANHGGGRPNPTLMQIAQNWASGGVNLGDMNQQMTNLIAGGNYSQADQDAVWNYIGGLKPGQNYYETQTYADWINK